MLANAAFAGLSIFDVGFLRFGLEGCLSGHDNVAAVRWLRPGLQNRTFVQQEC